MVPPGLAELKSNANGVGGDIEGRDDIIRCKFPEFDSGSVIVKVVHSHGLEVEFLLDEVDLAVCDFELPLQDPLDVVDVHSQFLFDGVDAHVLGLDVWPSKALQTPVCLQQIRLELLAEIDHIRAEGVEAVFLVLGDLVKYFLDFGEDLVEDEHLFIEKAIRE